MSTKISWCDETWNVSVGCTPVSPGCENCWAAAFAHRGLSPSHRGLTRMTSHGPRWTGKVRCLPERLEQPLRWRKPRRVFVVSMGDLFHPGVPDGFLDEIFGVMALADHHTFQVLTKRPERMLTYFTNEYPWAMIEGAAQRIHYERTGEDLSMSLAVPGPLPNVWLGVTVENRDALWRISDLAQTPAMVRFASFEPLLEDLGELELRTLDWVIVGGESGARARPMEEDWVRSIRDQCIAAGVPFFYKQHTVNGKTISMPELDGRVWAEFPKERAT